MKKVKKSAGVDPHVARSAHAARVRRRDRRLVLRAAIALAVVLPLAAIGLWQYERSAAGERDLSVIGNGQPTVVQVLDHGCAECRELRRNVDAAAQSFGDRVQFRLADRGTADGAILASRHNADHTTLLFFGPDGRLRRTEIGVRDPDAIRQLVTAAFPDRASESRR